MLVICAIAAALAVVGCGGGTGASDGTAGSGDSTAAKVKGPPPVESIPQPPATAKKVVLDKKEPKISLSPVPVPTELGIKDLEAGTGAGAKDGDELTVMYVGVFCTTGRLLSSSWDWGQPRTFKLGAGQENVGWEKGLKGMRVGGRRELLIPARMGTQSRNPPSHDPDEAMAYTIDLFAID